MIQTAKEEGLEFGLRIADLAAGRNGELGDPLYAYKVYVEDGREELVRGMQFRPVNTRALKRILAAGQERDVYNDFSDVSFSVISPSILMEELDLVRTEREFDKLPLIKSPIARGEKPSS